MLSTVAIRPVAESYNPCPVQSGAAVNELFAALLLLTLPDGLTFHALLPFPRFAERPITYTPHRFLNLSLSLSCQAIMIVLTLIVSPVQYSIRFVVRWNRGFAIPISASRSLQYSIAFFW